jgi:glutathione S-transferase
MELYISPNSVCCQKVQLVLAEKGLEPTFHMLNLRAGDSKAPDYLKLNPRGMVPTLIDQGRPVIESSVIIVYLDEVYPEPPLSPADPFDRADMRRWMQLPDTALHDACVMLTFTAGISPEVVERQIEANPDPAARARWRTMLAQGVDYPPLVEKLRVWDRSLAEMAGRLAGHEWLAGSAYSFAETALLPYVERLADLGQDWMWLERSGREAIQPWLDRCRARRNYVGMSRWYSHEGAAAMKVDMRTNGLRARPRLEALLAA